MDEVKHFRKLMEAINVDDYNWGEVFVYDSHEDEISEVNLQNELERARFERKYGFEFDSIFDIPAERGVRHFELHNINPPKTVIVSPDMQALAAEVETLTHT